MLVGRGIARLGCLVLLVVGLYGCGGSSSTGSTSYSVGENGSRGLFQDENGDVILRIDAGQDEIADAGTLVTLNATVELAGTAGTGSASFLWSPLAGAEVAEILDPDAQITLVRIPDLSEQTILRFQLQVDNGLGHQATDTVSIIVLPLDKFLGVETTSLLEPASNQAATIGIQLTEPQAETVSLTYYTLDDQGSALVGEDYQAVAGTITFAPGETQAEIEIQLLSDFEAEDNEVFFLEFADSSNPNLIYGRFPIVIEDQNLSVDVLAQVTGLVGELQLANGESTVLVSGNGEIPLLRDVPVGTPYDFQLTERDISQVCELLNGAGVAGASDPVIIRCEGVAVQVNVDVVALDQGVTLRLNEELLTISSQGSFQFEGRINEGQSYQVLVQQLNRGQDCTLENAQGEAGLTDINVTLRCVSTFVAVGGTATGIGAPVELTLIVNDGASAGDQVLLTQSGSFKFDTQVTPGDSYVIAVEPAAGLSCSLDNGAGTVPEAGIDSVQLSCDPILFSIAADITGLTGDIEVYSASGITPVFQQDGQYVIETLPYGDDYSYDFSTPSHQNCEIAGATSGTVQSDLTLAVNCENKSISLAVNVQSVYAPLELVLYANAEMIDSLVIREPGDYVFEQAELFHGDNYRIALSTSDQDCSGLQTSGEVDVINPPNVQYQCVADLGSTGRVSLDLPLSNAMVSINHGPDFSDQDDCTQLVASDSGFVTLDPNCYAQPGWYLVRSYQFLGETRTSEIFALLTQAQLQRGDWQVNLYTHVLYLKLRYLLSWENWNESLINERLDSLSSLLLQDYDLASTDYDALVQFDYNQQPEIDVDIAQRAEMARYIRSQFHPVYYRDMLFPEDEAAWPDSFFHYDDWPGITAMDYGVIGSSQTPHLFVSMGEAVSATFRLEDPVEEVTSSYVYTENNEHSISVSGGIMFTLNTEGESTVANAWRFGSTGFRPVGSLALPPRFLQIGPFSGLIDTNPDAKGALLEYSQTEGGYWEYLYWLALDPLSEKETGINVQHSVVDRFSYEGDRPLHIRALQGDTLVWKQYATGITEIVDFTPQSENNSVTLRTLQTQVPPTEIYNKQGHFIYASALSGGDVPVGPLVNVYDLSNWSCCYLGAPQPSYQLSGLMKGTIRALHVGRAISNPDFNEFLYVVTDLGIYVYSLADPVYPELRHFIDLSLPGNIQHIIADDNHIYAADSQGVYVYRAPARTVPYFQPNYLLAY